MKYCFGSSVMLLLSLGDPVGNVLNQFCLWVRYYFSGVAPSLNSPFENKEHLVPGTKVYTYG